VLGKGLVVGVPDAVGLVEVEPTYVGNGLVVGVPDAVG
jgi:hypothetical protein